MKTYVFIIMVALIIALVALAFWLWWLYRRERQNRAHDFEHHLSEERRLRKAIIDQSENLLHYRDLYNHQLVRSYDLTVEKCELTDKLSALLCPTNNHVWKDGKCVKCGRRQHELD